MTRPRRTLAALGLALAAGLLAAPAAGLLAAPAGRMDPHHGGGQHQVPIFGGGTDLFRALLDKAGIQPVPAQHVARANQDLIVIVIGTTDPVNGIEPLHYARLALQHGGAALVATDTPTLFHEFDRNPDLAPITRISGHAIVANARDCYQPDPNDRRGDTPFVVPISPAEQLPNGVPPGRVWAVFRGLNKIATDDPSYFDRPREFRSQFQYPLARLPKSCSIAGGRAVESPLFAVGGEGAAAWNGRSDYSFLAVADASVYINQMLVDREIDNLTFALRTIEYLQGPEKHRTRCLFFENGEIVDKFDGLKAELAKLKPKPPPVPNLGPKFGQKQEELANLIDKQAGRLQDRDELHRSMIGPPGSDAERRAFAKVIEGAAILGAIAAVLFLLRRTLSARQPQDVPPPPNTGAGAAPTGPPGVFDRRQRELVRRNNLYEPVRDLIREFFAAGGAEPGPRMPPLKIDRRAVRKPDSLHQAVRDMWLIAYGPPAHISAQRWFELEPYFDRLRAAHEEGKWRFAADEA